MDLLEAGAPRHRCSLWAGDRRKAGTPKDRRQVPDTLDLSHEQLATREGGQSDQSLRIAGAVRQGHSTQPWNGAPGLHLDRDRWTAKQRFTHTAKSVSGVTC